MSLASFSGVLRVMDLGAPACLSRPAEGGAAAQLQSLGQQAVHAASRVSSVYLDDPRSLVTYRDRLRREHNAAVNLNDEDHFFAHCKCGNRARGELLLTIAAGAAIASFCYDAFSIGHSYPCIHHECEIDKTHSLVHVGYRTNFGLTARHPLGTVASPVPMW